MDYYIPEVLIAKANKAYKDSPLPGQDAMAAAIRAIKSELWDIVVNEYETDKLIDQYLEESHGSNN